MALNDLSGLGSCQNVLHLPGVVRSWGLGWKLVMGIGQVEGFVGANRHAGIVQRCDLLSSHLFCGAILFPRFGVSLAT